MLTPPVTAAELDHCMEAVDAQQFKMLSLVFKAGDGVLNTRQILKIALYDCFLAWAGQSSDAAMQLIHCFEPFLDKLADRWDVRPPEGQLPVKPYGMFSLMDYRFAAVYIAHLETPNAGFYDIKTGKYSDILPHHALTGFTCDLTVLLTRLSAKITRGRELQERTDAGRKPAADVKSTSG